MKTIHSPYGVQLSTQTAKQQFFPHQPFLSILNPVERVPDKKIAQCTLFKVNPIKIVMAIASVTGIPAAWAAEAQVLPYTFNGTVTKNTPSNLTSPIATQNRVVPTTKDTPTASSALQTDANTNQPYVYSLNQQRVEDKIGQQLDNQRLTDYSNFNQPIATLKQNQPSVGYSKALDQATPQSVAKQINATSLAPVATVNPKTHAEAQVTEQLKTESDNVAAINQGVTAQTNIVNQSITHQNSANQTEDIQATDAINPNDYLPAYQQQATATTTPQANSTVTAEPQGIVARLKNKLIGRGEGLNYIDITFANADAKLEPARNIKAALGKVTVESVSDFGASVNKLRQIAKDAAEAVGYYDTKIAFKHLGKDNIQVSLDVGKPVIVQSRIIDIRGEGGKGDNSLPVYPVIEKEIPPKEGDVFNHGVYKAAKATIEGVGQTNGYFDAKWLNSSVDIILPDNTADVDLIYDTKGRYHFDEVKVYSIDKEGNLTDDPDKLPLKPKLLKALMTYQKGDPYYQPFVTEFTNNLSATRYFNGVDVDVVMPSDEVAGNIDFEKSGMSANTANTGKTTATDTATTDGATTDGATTDGATTDGATSDTATNKLATASDSQEAKSELNTRGTVSSTSQRPANQVQNPSDIAPIKFEVDDSTEKRLSAISKKAKSLLSAPEDMELSPEAENKSKNPLVVIANAVSKAAKKLDKDKDLPIRPREDQVIAKLSPLQVYEQKQIPTYVVLNATKPHEAQIGLGYETNAGVRLVGKYNNNLVNRSGLQTGATVALSKVDQAVEFNASLPYKHPLNDKLTGTIGYEHKKVDDIINTFEADTIYASIARNIYHDSGWNRTYSLRYRGDKLQVDPNKYSTENLPYPFNNYASDYTQQALLAGYAINKTVADNMLAPDWGYSQRYSIEMGAKGLLSDTNMAILRAGGTGMYSFGKDRKQQVIGRLDLGYLYSGDFYDVPYRSRFFAGGDNSIRGYNTDSLGPSYGGERFLVGGNALAVGSAEYNYEFRPNLRGAVFTDFGNAYDLDSNYSNSTAMSIGTGIRWKSPIGLVRLDVAKGLTGDNKDIHLHFFIGSPL